MLSVTTVLLSFSFALLSVRLYIYIFGVIVQCNVAQRIKWYIPKVT